MNRLLTTAMATLLLSCARDRTPSNGANPPRIVVVTEQRGGGDPLAEPATAPAEESGTTGAPVYDSAGGSEAWLGGSALRTRVVTGSDGENRLGIWVDPPAIGLHRMIQRCQLLPIEAQSMPLAITGNLRGPHLAHSWILWLEERAPS